MTTLCQMEAQVCRWQTEVAQLLAEPFVVTDQGWTVSGVLWVQGSSQNVPPPKSALPVIKHRCECGHEHVDQRATR